MALKPAPLVRRPRTEKILDASAHVGEIAGEVAERLRDPFHGLDFGNACRRAKVRLHEAYALRDTFRHIGQEFDGDGQAVILAMRQKRAEAPEASGIFPVELLSVRASSLGNQMMIGPDGPIFGSIRRSGGRITGVDSRRFSLKEALEFVGDNQSGYCLDAGSLVAQVRGIAKRHRTESIHLVSDGPFSAEGVSSRRRIYEGVDFRCIVFTLDLEAGQYSVRSAVESLAQATAEEFQSYPNYLRWYEHRTETRTRDDKVSIPFFERIAFNSPKGLQNPQWYICDEEFGAIVRELVEAEDRRG